MTTIAERLARVHAQIAASCAAVGRSPDEVLLVAVSKTHPPATILEALNAGQHDFGENRPEEAVAKIAAVQSAGPAVSPRWHMIGHVQSRKARLVVPRFDMIHSLDSVRLAVKYNSLASELNCELDVLLEMNVSGEESKSGFATAGWPDSSTVRESLWSDIRSILSMSALRVRGLMTMAPLVEDPEEVRPVFASLRGLRDALRCDFGQVDWAHLSMGMSDDYAVAITEGATIVRVGRAIFGPRVEDGL